jgi:hypothetical protein
MSTVKKVVPAKYSTHIIKKRTITNGTHGIYKKINTERFIYDT